MSEITPAPRRSLHALALLSGAFLFLVMGSLLAVYVDARSAVKPWPPKGVYPDNFSAVMVTITLLIGSAMVEWAARSVKTEERGVLTGLFLAGAFGLAAVNALGFIFVSFNFGVASHLYGTVVYSLLIVSMIAVSIATIICFANGIRSLNERTGGDYESRIRAVATFWHAVVIAWCAMYAAVYLVK